MKITNYVLVFALILTSVITVTFIRTQQLHVLLTRQTQYNQALDDAIQSGLSGAIEVDDGKLHLNYKTTTDVFFKSVYSSFGLSDNPEAQKQFIAYVPVIAVMDVDGFYIRYITDVHGPEENWTSKIPYTYTNEVSISGVPYKFTVNFRLDDELQMTVFKHKRVDGSYAELSGVYEGKISEIMNIYSEESNGDDFKIFRDVWNNCFITNMYGDQTYDTIKADCVGQVVAKYLNKYVDDYNEIARNFGISYKFSVPATAASDIARSMEDIMFICLFQGYPYGSGTSDTFSKFTVSGARITKSGVFYVRKADDGITYYHNGYCNHDGRQEQGDIYYSKKSAARDGAYPCPYCNP